MRNWRILFIVILLLASGGGLIARLAFLQIYSHGFYKALAKGQQSLPSVAVGERGDIFFTDKQGSLYTAATVRKVPFVFVVPREVEDKESAAALLAEALAVPEESIAGRLLKEESLFEVLKRQLTAKEEEAVRELGLPGVYVRQESVRFYPYEALASRVLGFVNQDWEGQYGVEKRYDARLQGKEGLARTIRNVAGYLLQTGGDTLQDGEDVRLTIDFNIQSMAEALLERAAANHGIEEGTVIVMDPMTGAILALANYPTFDPNSYSKVSDLNLFRNPAVQDIFEPGSVFKPLTMASGIDSGKLTPQTTYVDTGEIRIGGYTVSNYDERVWGERSMTEVLEFSINTGAVFAEQQTGHGTFLEYAERFKMFAQTGVDLAGEVFSANRELKRGYEINFATASFGQGIEITPMQLVRSYAVLANGGRLVTPYVTVQEPQASQLVISERTAAKVTAMLVSVTENGFAGAARVPGYYVAGKTGTAQVSFAALGENRSGYSDKTIQSFIGYAPAFQPRFVALVKLNNPATRTAEYSAVPVFQELAKYITDYYAIPPDYVK
ncbi:MAG: penicillin-binding protein 2 [bacterium]|nr:penicillin-binding protein 2 [bacterium]